MSKEVFDVNYQELVIGDRIVILHNENQELDDWYEANGRGFLVITEIEEESELLWAEECPHSIEMACVLRMNEGE